MIVRVYKNNNFTVKFEPKFDPPLPNKLGKFIEMLANDNDAPDVHAVEECYPHWCVTFLVNGKPRYYFVDDEDLERFIDGYTVRFVYDSDAPLFTLPKHYDSHRMSHKGEMGTLYKLCDKEIDGDLIGILVACGCVPFTVQSEYAPELKSVGIWVPDGTCFEYE